ncbi:MAG: DUF3108 domain-containing protein [Saprospiraceae bacterium]
MITKITIKCLIASLLLLSGGRFYIPGKAKLGEIVESGNLSPCTSQNTSFRSGETLTYKIYYNWNFVWLSAGELTFKVLDDDDQYHVQVVGKTYDSYNWFFEVEDYFDTWIQKENLLPIRSIKSIKEGKYRLYDDLTFDQFHHKVYNERGKAKDDIRERRHFELAGCMHDMVSILYYCRNIDFSKSQYGETYPIKIFADKETWPLSVTFKGRQSDKKIKGMGRFKTLQFSPQVIEGELFPEGAQVNVWATDDENRLPLVIESPLSVGSVKAVLTQSDGLRHPFHAKIDN